MVIGSKDQHGQRYYCYRCPPVGDCPRRVTISADIAEQVVVEAVRARLEGMTGRATVADGVDEAERELERARRNSTRPSGRSPGSTT